MKELLLRILVVCVLFILPGTEATESAKLDGHHHHHHHHHRHGRGRNQRHHRSLQNQSNQVETELNRSNAKQNLNSARVDAAGKTYEAQILGKMHMLEKDVEGVQDPPGSVHTSNATGSVQTGRLRVNGPLTPDFAERFQQAVAQATGCEPSQVSVKDQHSLRSSAKIIVIDFSAPSTVVHSVENQAADPESQLANGPLRPFLIDGEEAAPQVPQALAIQPAAAQPAAVQPAVAQQDQAAAPAPVATQQDSHIDIDTEMPYGELEPFGREDTAQELSEDSIQQSDEMVDQLERAEVAEEKRSVFRALTRLRGAAITSFDGIARSQTGNIDEYNKVHQWRQTHPLNHLADEESDVTKWAFPSDADF